MMKLEKALEIVIDLAHENGHNLIDWDPELDDPKLESKAKDQAEAMKLCESLLAILDRDRFEIIFSEEFRNL